MRRCAVLRNSPTVTQKNASTNSSDPVDLLTGYRDQLARLLASAEAAAPHEPPVLRAAVDSLVEALNADLLRLYRDTEARRRKSKEAAIVVPALERLRNILRHRDVRVRPMRDTLHKAVIGLPLLAQAVSDSTGLGSS
jgi:hypothetical protein